MSVAYHAIGWNRQKRFYDLTLAAALALALAVYAVLTFWLRPATTIETFVIRFTAIAALTLLHVIFAIGPLARLDRRFLPLLYNRRHLGVTMFLLALAHGVFAIVQFHAGGDANPLVSVLTAYRRDYVSGEIAQFPFEVLGLAALAILFVMAATSHDFWLRNLGASFWKTLHMLVYAAYALIVLHVCLGALQSERSPVLASLLSAGFVVLVSLHLAAFWKERRLDRARTQAKADGFTRVARCDELEEGRGKIVMVDGERRALFLHDGKIFALSNVCRHQGGPLGEGRIVFGCLTCPWHGYQYRLEDGCSPPPFTEVVPTYAVRVIGDDIYVGAQPLPLGEKSDGAPAPRSATPPHEESDFYIGWQAKMAATLGRFTTRAAAAIVIGALVAIGLAATFQNPVDTGVFEYGVIRTFEGTLRESPLPLLEIPASPTQSAQNFLLCGAGKSGPPAEIRGHDGQHVRFKGSLIARSGMTMIEMNDPGSFTALGAAGAAPERVVPLGDGVFIGDLVDTKCFLGVMRPATGKVHRGCAVRCLSGGVPPGLLVRDASGDGIALLLVGEEGRALDIDPELAARVLKVSGSLELRDGTPVLRVRDWKLHE
jgi:DMSO/TMAO reductase YedYZ heme-binding membrane subunit/nitrite reductase/ring-hydroxylating ferredoxin subunit